MPLVCGLFTFVLGTAPNYIATFWACSHIGRVKRDVELEATIVAKYVTVAPVLDELSRRRWAAAESLAIGYGGDALVSSATGLARETRPRPCAGRARVPQSWRRRCP